MLFKKGDILECVDNTTKQADGQITHNDLVVGNRYTAAKDGAMNDDKETIVTEGRDTAFFAYRFICVQAVCTCDRRFVALGGGCTCGAIQRERGSREQHEQRTAR